jgi:acylphosphatase
VKERADELGIKGWVRNTDDGAVEILAEGEEDSLDQFRQWCRKGPPMAQVEDLTETIMNEDNHLEFRIV